jgi:hypothetical protein
MKFFAVFFLLVSFSAFAQNLHMIEMSTSTSALGAFTYSDSGPGSASSTSGYVGGNYAYKISPRVQLGVQANYSRFHSDYSTTEGYNFMVGGILNFSDDLTNAFYTSLYGGMGWNHYSGNGNNSIENLNGKVAFGKRFALTSLNLPNVTYSPEISYTRSEYTKSAAYGVNNVSIRFLQFSVFF